MLSGDAESLKKKNKALIVFRALFITLLFGSSFFFRGSEQLLQTRFLYYLIGALYFLTLIYSFLLEKVRSQSLFAYVQLVLDVVASILLIYVTGGVESWFSFPLVLIIIASSIILDKRAGFVIATLSSILYGILVNLQLYDVLPVSSVASAKEPASLYKLFVHVLFFYLTAYLSGYLSARLESTVQELEQTDLDLRNLELFNKEVIESLPSGLFTVDTSGKILLFNYAAERIIGMKSDAAIGKKIDVVMPFFPFPFLEGRREQIIPADGGEKIIGITISPLKGIAYAPEGFIAVFQDLTQIKKLEDEIKKKEKLAAVGELSSNIAHEIRNPLASLKGSIEMLREDSVSPNHKERLMDIALKEMERLNHIISDFLTYSRPTLPVFQTFDIRELLDETVELLSNINHNKELVSFRKNYQSPLRVHADPQKMHQVFWNLGVNAIEAMPDGGELSIDAVSLNNATSITFRDSGNGIEEKDIGKVFYPFFTTKEQGTGLGLAIAYRIIDEHNGRITVKSTSGIGTTFEIILPAPYEKA
jgi:two-component system sensor histidine kinase PilS (NtrC family)